MGHRPHSARKTVCCFECPWQDSNLRPHGSEPCTLNPLSYRGMEWNRRESNPGLSGANRVLSQLSYGPICCGAASAPGRARTDDPRFTKPVLLPTELQGRKRAGRQGVEPCAPGFGVQAAPGARPMCLLRVPALGIEPSPPALQTGARTTYAKPACAAKRGQCGSRTRPKRFCRPLPPQEEQAMKLPRRDSNPQPRG